jgi:hypothetical protein
MRESRIGKMKKIYNCEDFLTEDLAKDKILQKQAISMHKQDVEYNYLYAHFRALEQNRKKGQDEEVQAI